MLIRENYVQLLIFKLLQIELFNNISFESFLFSYSRTVSEYNFNPTRLSRRWPYTVYEHQIVKKSDYYVVIQ